MLTCLSYSLFSKNFEKLKEKEKSVTIHLLFNN